MGRTDGLMSGHGSCIYDITPTQFVTVLRLFTLSYLDTAGFDRFGEKRRKKKKRTKLSENNRRRKQTTNDKATINDQRICGFIGQGKEKKNQFVGRNRHAIERDLVYR